VSPEERLTKLEVEMINVRDDYKDMRADHKLMAADIRVIRETLQEAKGGWKALMIVGGAGATLGGLLVKFLPVVFK